MLVHKCGWFKLVGFIADFLPFHINLALQSGYLYNQFMLNIVSNTVPRGGELNYLPTGAIFCWKLVLRAFHYVAYQHSLCGKVRWVKKKKKKKLADTQLVSTWLHNHAEPSGLNPSCSETSGSILLTSVGRSE